MRALRMVALAGVAAAALAGVFAGTAAANPPTGVTPATTDIVGVGSDTVTPLFDAWSTAYNGQSPAPTNKLYSWDATTPVPFKTKNDSACNLTTQPNGSSAGIKALNLNTKTADGNYCIDYARSSRALSKATDGNVSGVLVGQDAITYSVTSGGNGVKNLTTAQLQAIYLCTDTNWSQVGGASAPIVAVLPQTGSGSRATFLSAIGVTTPGTCVINGVDSSGNPIEENEGTNAVFGGTNAPNVIFPFSIGAYLCNQYNQAACTQRDGNLVLESIDGDAPTVGTGSGQSINTGFGASYYRPLLAVVRGSSVPTYLQTVFGDGTGDGTGWVCSTAAQNEVTAEYFLSPSLCGLLQLPQ